VIRLSTFLGFSLLLLLSCTLACNDRAAKLPDYGHVPEFEMTDSQGRHFDSKQIADKVWVVDFIYTNCPGPCPRMTSEMHSVQKQLKGDPDVRMISISVDPAHDTPPVLDAFAHRFDGPNDQWFFLTGTPATVHLLAHEVFKVGDVISNMDHSTKFMLVDKHGDLRGYYSTLDGNEIPALLRDIEALSQERS
jgi:protein SCO1